MLKENQKTIEQIDEIQKNIIGEHTVFSRQSGKTGMMIRRLKMYSCYENIKKYISTTKEIITLSDANDILYKILSSSDSENVDENYQDLVFMWMSSGRTLDESIILAKDSYINVNDINISGQDVSEYLTDIMKR